MRKSGSLSNDFFIFSTIRLRLIISFADTEQGHDGIIYQAGNWLYLGTTPPDKFPIIDGVKRHPRTLSDMIKRGIVEKRSDIEHIETKPKHRYGYVLDSTIKDNIKEFVVPFASVA